MANTSDLPEDALQEILLRLPVKSLVRFRCVSKSWFALLKSNHFIDKHLKFSLARRDDENLLITRFLREENKNRLSIHSNDESLSVLVPNLELHGYSDERLAFAGSCDGIVCLSSYRDIILFNPATRESRTLPRLPCPDGWHFNREGMGFVFDSLSNDYKVVQIVAVDDGICLYPYYCKGGIYNLSTDTWKELDVVLPRIFSNFDSSFGLFFNGKTHWRAAYPFGEEFDGQEFILSMDISTEVFHKFPYPELDVTIVDEDAADSKSLLVIKDCLALIVYTTRYPRAHPYEQRINIWVMKEYGVAESWSKQYSIGPLSGILCPFSICWKNEQLLLQRAWNIRGDEREGSGYDCELVAWDAVKNEEVQKYDVYGFEQTMGVVVYKETLLSITGT